MKNYVLRKRLKSKIAPLFENVILFLFRGVEADLTMFTASVLTCSILNILNRRSWLLCCFGGCGDIQWQNQFTIKDSNFNILMTRVNYWINIPFHTFVKKTHNCLIYVAFSFGVAHICELHCTSHMLFKQILWLLWTQLASIPTALYDVYSVREGWLYSIFVLCSLTWWFKHDWHVIFCYVVVCRQFFILQFGLNRIALLRSS
jgi:hypothetical protein